MWGRGPACCLDIVWRVLSPLLKALLPPSWRLLSHLPETPVPACGVTGTSVPRYMFLSLPPPLENPPCLLSCSLLTMDNCFCSAHPFSPHPPIGGAMTWGLVPGPPPDAKSLLNYRMSTEPQRASSTRLQPRVGCSALCWVVMLRVRPSSHLGCPARCWMALLQEAMRDPPLARSRPGSHLSDWNRGRV